MIERLAVEMGQKRAAFIRNAALDVARALIEAKGEEPEA